MSKCLNLGCGSVKPVGWVNIDYSFGARLSKIPFYRVINKHLKVFDTENGQPRDWTGVLVHNLLNGLPFENDSADCIYASHVLEHFSKGEGRDLLRECFRVLRRGGILRVVVPDLEYLVCNYREGKTRADDFVESLLVLYERKENPIKNHLATVMQFPHRCMYDGKTLVAVMNGVGFKAEKKMPFESLIPGLPEMANRTENAVIVEGIK